MVHFLIYRGGITPVVAAKLKPILQELLSQCMCSWKTKLLIRKKPSLFQKRTHLLNDQKILSVNQGWTDWDEFSTI